VRKDGSLFLILPYIHLGRVLLGPTVLTKTVLVDLVQLPVLQIVHVVAWSAVYVYRVMALASLAGAGLLPLQVTGAPVLRSHFFYGWPDRLPIHM